MSATDQARAELVGALNLLMRRRSATSDPAEKEQINESIDVINEQLQEIGHASLLEAASLAAAAAGELDKVVATARTGAFEAFVGQAQALAGRLRAVATDGSGPRMGAGARATATRTAPARKVAARTSKPKPKSAKPKPAKSKSAKSKLGKSKLGKSKSARSKPGKPAAGKRAIKRRSPRR